MAEKPTPTLAEQYDVTQEHLAPPAAGGAAPDEGQAAARGEPPPPPSEGATPPAAPTPPRDPQTGRFVGPDQGRYAPVEPGAIAPPPAPSAHSPTLIRLAFDLGLAPEEIDALDTPTLSAVVRAAQQEQQAARRHSASDQAVSAGAERAASARQERAAPQGPSAKDLGLDDGLEWEPSLLALLKGMSDKLAALDGLKLGELREDYARQRQRTARQQVEAVLARDYAQFMGPEPGPKATARDPALAKRQMLAQFVDAQLKDEPGGFEDKLHLAMLTLFGQKRPGGTPAAPAPAPQAAGITAEQWREAALAAPTHRRGAAEPKGREAAVRSLEQHMRENGLSQRGDQADTGDDFLE